MNITICTISHAEWREEEISLINQFRENWGHLGTWFLHRHTGWVGYGGLSFRSSSSRLRVGVTAFGTVPCVCAGGGGGGGGRWLRCFHPRAAWWVGNAH